MPGPRARNPPPRTRWTSPRPAGNVSAMIDPKLLDDLARRIASGVPSGLGLLQDDLRRNLRSSLEAALARMDLITREEFDTQAAVLARTREMLERLERQVAELERRSAEQKPNG